MKDNGLRMDTEKVKESKYGKMVQFTKDTGKKIKRVGKDDWFIQMEIATMENGCVTRHMVKVFTNMQTVEGL